MILIPNNYISTLIKTCNTHKEVKKELKTYSDRHGYDEEETVYYFVLKLIKNKIYFELNTKEYDELLYDAIYWSSKEENKKKTRPKNAKDIKVKKDNNKFISLQKEILKLTYDNFASEEFLFDEYLVKYFTIFFELSSIKRDRR